MDWYAEKHPDGNKEEAELVSSESSDSNKYKGTLPSRWACLESFSRDPKLNEAPSCCIHNIVGPCVSRQHPLLAPTPISSSPLPASRAAGEYAPVIVDQFGNEIRMDADDKAKTLGTWETVGGGGGAAASAR